MHDIATEQFSWHHVIAIYQPIIQELGLHSHQVKQCFMMQSI